jgi:hypothetical protein
MEEFRHENDAVIITERGAQALADAEDALAQLLHARRVLQAICARPAIEGGWRETGRVLEMREAAFAAAGVGEDGADRHLRRDAVDERWQQDPAVQLWAQARAALRTDPDAVLPP